MKIVNELDEPRIASYLVTDIETDGPSVGLNSMRSFASAVVLADGSLGASFAAALEPLPDAEPDPRTLAWFQANPEAWRHATENPERPDDVMARYAVWVRQQPWPRVFVSHPLTFDGIWVDFYLRRFTGAPLFTSLFDVDPLFFGDGIDLPTFIAGRLQVDYSMCVRKAYPREWFRGYEHTHRAIDDAMGYACVLSHVLNSRPIKDPIAAAQQLSSR